MVNGCFRLKCGQILAFRTYQNLTFGPSKRLRNDKVFGAGMVRKDKLQAGRAHKKRRQAVYFNWLWARLLAAKCLYALTADCATA